MAMLFPEFDRSLWPSLRILSVGRENRSAPDLLELIMPWVESIASAEADEPDLSELRPPASPRKTIDWIFSIWKRFEASENTESLTVLRHRVMRDIVDDTNDENLRSRLFSAADYLFRLAQARKVAADTGASTPPSLARTRSSRMQLAYRNLVDLAATDLPIWLTGERGSKLREPAVQAHNMRGFPADLFHGVDHGGGGGGCYADNYEAFLALPAWRAGGTIYVPRIDDAPLSVQRALYDYLLEDLSDPGETRVIVSSGPVDFRSDSSERIFPDLFVFLGPTRIDIPPLRFRPDDIPDLMAAHAASRRMADPAVRLADDTLEILLNYHWPGNIGELELVTSYIIQRRPSGEIRAGDLPDNLKPAVPQSLTIGPALGELYHSHGFRSLNTEDRRAQVVAFLEESTAGTFTAREFSERFRIGRETVGRLLSGLMEKGVIEGLTGAKGRRVTRYRLVDGDRSE